MKHRLIFFFLHQSKQLSNLIKALFDLVYFPNIACTDLCVHKLAIVRCFLWVMVRDTLLKTTTSCQWIGSMVYFNEVLVWLLYRNQCHYNVPQGCIIIKSSASLVNPGDHRTHIRIGLFLTYLTGMYWAVKWLNGLYVKMRWHIDHARPIRSQYQLSIMTFHH